MATRLLRYKPTGETLEVPEESTVARLNSGKYEELGAGSSFTILMDPGAARVLQLTDVHRYLRFTNAGAVTVTVLSQTDVAWIPDAEVIIEQAGDGQVTLSPGSGVTLRTSSTLKTNAKYSAMTLKRVAQDEWVVGGDRSAS